MRLIYTPEQLDWLREHYPRMALADLTAAFNENFPLSKTPNQIKSTLKNHNITCGRPRGQLNKGRSIYTAEQTDWLRENYPRLPLKELTQDFNAVFNQQLSAGTVHSACKRFGIQCGRDGRFKQGFTPWNTGTKGLVAPNSGNFANGHRPKNWVPIGSERINGDGYRDRKLTDTGVGRVDWVPVHRIVWEQANGPLPVGQAVIFIDGDKTNIALDNLQDVSRGELGVLNKQGFTTLPLQLRRTFIATVKLQVAANKLQRDNASLR